MATIEKFEDLEIWKEARLLSKEIILLSKNTELKTDYKLKEQIKGSSGSVMDNIAEGFERDGNLEFRQFYQSQKVRRKRPAHRCIEFSIPNISQKKNDLLWLIGI